MVCVNVMVVAIWLINAFHGEREESEELRGLDFKGFEEGTSDKGTQLKHRISAKAM